MFGSSWMMASVALVIVNGAGRLGFGGAGFTLAMMGAEAGRRVHQTARMATAGMRAAAAVRVMARLRRREQRACWIWLPMAARRAAPAGLRRKGWSGSVLVQSG